MRTGKKPSHEFSFWAMPADEAIKELKTSRQGLAHHEAKKRLDYYGANTLKKKKKSTVFHILLNQFKTPIVVILLGAAVLSFFLQATTDAIIIMIIVLLSGLLGFWQERRASIDVEKLLSIVKVKANVLRDGRPKKIPVEEVVPGDIVLLSAGDSVPGDCLILDSKDLFVDESALTGESYPAEKIRGMLSEGTALKERANSLFMGTHVISGTAKAVVVHTAKATKFGEISEHLNTVVHETEFEIGVRRFGFLLMKVTMALIAAIFVINVVLARPLLESLIFSLAIAVGLTPQLLPAIISINLAKGASYMARHKVIVKRLNCIENFGSMNVLCFDKTGTLTEGMVHINSFIGIGGEKNDKVALYAYLNAFYESGFSNPIDEAIRSHRHYDISGYKKADEIPYDFNRKLLSILTAKNGRHVLITKGAAKSVLDICSKAEVNGKLVDVGGVRKKIESQFDELSMKGFRALGLAYKNFGADQVISKEKERGMIFLGFVVLHDPPKKGVIEVIKKLEKLGIKLKIVTGDNQLVASNLMKEIGIAETRILTGSDISQLSDGDLAKRVAKVELFAEVEPSQKERIILALQHAGNVVGYMGDGINDAPALHVADVGISVDDAVDVAKETADIVLLKRDLEVIAQGVKEGRKTFANTMKYVFMATSANFGNMLSMAGASLFLPFIPLLPKQILLTNLVTDMPEMTIATDNVDKELEETPKKLDIKFIGNFMLLFGAVSSIFDYITFMVLLFVLNTPSNLVIAFRTGWFIESVISASVIVLVIRSRKPFFKSRPGKYLVITTLLVAAFTLALPYTPLGPIFGFRPLPVEFLAAVGAIVLFYVITAEIAKRVFYGPEMSEEKKEAD